MTIDELAIKYKTDKSSLDHNYTQFYQKYYDIYVKNPKKILELGIYTTTNPTDLISSGASLKTWSEYFPECNIYGLDLPDFSILDNNISNIKTLPCNCELRVNDDINNIKNPWLKELYTTPKYGMIGGQIGLNNIEKVFGVDFDIIIDDGPHTMSGQQIFFGYMFKNLRSGGLFVIEDLCTSNISWGSTYNSFPYTEYTTLWMLQQYVKTGKIISDFITSDEKKYLEENIDEMFIEKGNNSEICFIIKK